MTTQVVTARPSDPEDPEQPRPVAPRAARAERIREVAVRSAIRLVILAVLLLLWQFASGRIFPVFVISSPGQVFERFGTALDGGQLFKDLAATMKECMLGFVIGSIVGSVCGLVFGIYESVARVISPFANMLYAMPKIMLSPLIVVWFGIGLTMKVAIATLSCLWVVFYNVWNATRRIDRNLLDQFRLMGANNGQIVAGLYLPSATTWLLTSLRIAFPIALIGAVVGEFIAGSEGLGHMALDAGQKYDAAGVLVAVLTVTITAVFIDAVLGAIQSRVALWQGEGERG
ncbi:ABC transporter permease [Cryptosporangium sp. NPDC048952]|uniref:ABC transporter permease n=1 Tax=Cryptosporangium sp. NPDC048952 TaxID=3363961 RepID=UPI0037154593